MAQPEPRALHEVGYGSFAAGQSNKRGLQEGRVAGLSVTYICKRILPDPHVSKAMYQGQLHLMVRMRDGDGAQKYVVGLAKKNYILQRCSIVRIQRMVLRSARHALRQSQPTSFTASLVLSH